MEKWAKEYAKQGPRMNFWSHALTPVWLLLEVVRKCGLSALGLLSSLFKNNQLLVVKFTPGCEFSTSVRSEDLIPAPEAPAWSQQTIKAPKTKIGHCTGELFCVIFWKLSPTYHSRDQHLRFSFPLFGYRERAGQFPVQWFHWHSPPLPQIFLCKWIRADRPL